MTENESSPKLTAEELDALWQGVRRGDEKSARRLVEYLITQGDEERIEVVVEAIHRSFERQMRQIARQAQGTTGAARSALVNEAISAFTKTAVIRHLPDLLRRSAQGIDMLGDGALPPPTNLQATGVDRGINLSWSPPTVLPPLTLVGQKVTVFDGITQIFESPILTSSTGSYSVSGLTNGKSYLLVVTALSTLLSSAADITAQAGAITTALPAAVGLGSQAINRGLLFTWNNPTPPSGSSITKYALSLTGDGLTRTAEVPAQPPLQYSFTDLVNGLPYTLAIQTIGTVGGTANQLGLTAVITGVAGLTGTPFIARIAPLPADPLLFLDPGLLDAVQEKEKLLAQANVIGNKWRYSYLNEKAQAAIKDALSFDQQIMQLMSMTLMKAVGAESQFTPVILAAIQALQNDVQELSSVTSAVPVVEAIEKVRDAVTNAVIMAAILEWLARTDAFKVWIEFFNALINDVISFDTSLSHVKDFIDSQYESGPLGAAVKRLAQAQLDTIGPAIAEVITPLRDAVALVIGSSSRKMGDVFKSFDLPLLMTETPDTLLPNINPLLQDLALLERAVAKLEQDITAQVRESLIDVIEGKAKALFRTLMIIYFATPLIIALGVALAGGPLAAALLAFIIAVAAQQLIHLIVNWITGPLHDQLEILNQAVQSAIKNLQRAIAYEVPVTAIINPESRLNLLQDELRQLRELLPQAFLDDVAELLADARTWSLETGILHALGAEHALGLDNSTAFDKILYQYSSHLSPATQMPGGNDQGLFAGAQLLRDMNRLEQDMVRLRDGKEVELTRRLSLFSLLGGVGDPVTASGVALGRFADFLKSGTATISLTPENLLDATMPGVYRSLIQEVSVFAISRAPVITNLLSTAGVSVTLTHQGKSWTRIKRDANPAAPPLELPLGFPDKLSYVLATTYRDPSAPFTLNSVEGRIWAIIAAITEDLTWASVRKALKSQLPSAIADLGNVCPTGREQATALNYLAGHGPENTIDDDRNVYYSSQNYDTASPPTPPWLAVTLSHYSPAITGIRIWARSGFRGFPTAYKIQVSESGLEADFRDIPDARISKKQVVTPGEEAWYYQFSPVSGKAVRILATTLTEGDTPGVYNLQMSDFQISVMNVTVINEPLINPESSPTLADHPASNLVNGDLNTYYSSVLFTTSSPGTAAPWFAVSFPSARLVSRVRIYPRQGVSQDFPIQFSLQLKGEKVWPFSYQNYTIVDDDPQDFYVPTYRVEELLFQATRLAQVPDDPGKYALQLTEIEAAAFFPNNSLVPPGPIEDAVTTILREMLWPPMPILDPVEAAKKIAQVLVDGVSERNIPGLSSTAATAWDDARSELLGHIAKWGGARVEEDPDPNVRGSNFVRLVRDSQSQAATFDLFPVDDGVQREGVLLRPAPSRFVSAAPQYRPFENLGIGCQFKIDVPQSALALLADLVIEVSVRGCYDPDLAAALQATSRQREQQIDRVIDIGVASSNRVLTLGAPEVKQGKGGLLTVQFSLRSQRDRILQAALAGAQVVSGSYTPPRTTIDGIDFIPNEVAPLGLYDAFSFFSASSQTLPTKISLSFAKGSDSSLLQQLTRFDVTPSVLGVDMSLLDGSLLPVDGQLMPALEGLAVTLIPMRNALNSFAPKPGTVDDRFKPLLDPSWSNPANVITARLSMTTPDQAATHAVLLTDLWPNDGTARILEVDLQDAIPNGELYDVIFSVSYRAPSLLGIVTSPGQF